MTARSAVEAGRRAARLLMVDACTISAPDVAGAINETTGRTATTTGTSKYSGACRVKVTGTQARTADAGELVIALRTFVVSVPITVTGIDVDDVVRLTASLLDADLVGTRLRVTDVAKGTHITARRLTCEEHSGA